MNLASGLVAEAVNLELDSLVVVLPDQYYEGSSESERLGSAGF